MENTHNTCSGGGEGRPEMRSAYKLRGAARALRTCLHSGEQEETPLEAGTHLWIVSSQEVPLSTGKSVAATYDEIKDDDCTLTHSSRTKTSCRELHLRVGIKLDA